MLHAQLRRGLDARLVRVRAWAGVLVQQALRHGRRRDSRGHPLAAGAPARALRKIATYGLAVPYLQQADGTPRLLAACDLEHSLCYFSRYLSARASLGAAGAEALSRAMPAGFRLYRIGKLQGLSAAKVWEDFDAHRAAGAGGALGAGPTTADKSRHY